MAGGGVAQQGNSSGHGTGTVGALTPAPGRVTQNVGPSASGGDADAEAGHFVVGCDALARYDGHFSRGSGGSAAITRAERAAFSHKLDRVCHAGADAPPSRGRLPPAGGNSSDKEIAHLGIEANQSLCVPVSTAAPEM
jgi:hypothetical protein